MNRHDRVPRRLLVGSLFSGYGGLDLGVGEVLDADLAWYADVCRFDKDGNAGHFTPHRAPCCILEHHHPGVPNLGDISRIDFSKVRRVDVLTGGFPCQDVSHAGRRAGLIRDGEGRTRSGLWGHMLRAIDEQRPSLVVAENVRGLLSARADSDLESCPWCMGDGDGEPPLRALGAVLADLADIGYDAAWYGFPASDVGATHGRFRVFVFAWPADSEGDVWRLLLRNAGAAAHADDRPGLGERSRPEPGDGGAEGLTLLPTPAVNDMGAAYEWDAWTDRMKAAHGNGNGHGKSLAIEAQRLLPTPTVQDGSNTGGPSQFDRNTRPLNTEVLLLPTPEAKLGSSGPDYARAAREGSGGDDLATTVALLPTPRATDGTKGGPNQRGSSGDLMLPSAVQSLPRATRGGSATETTALLPTPRVTQAGYADDGRGGKSLDVEARRGTNWGDYGPAIAHWEAVFGRPAPDPTEPGPKGNPRLSPAFVEWMMGLPAGHVIDPAIWEGRGFHSPSAIRSAQLKALGNGVVPQHAAAAAAAFLADVAALLAGDGEGAVVL